jgi:hypothetical protein
LLKREHRFVCSSHGISNGTTGIAGFTTHSSRKNFLRRYRRGGHCRIIIVKYRSERLLTRRLRRRRRGCLIRESRLKL